LWLSVISPVSAVAESYCLPHVTNARGSWLTFYVVCFSLSPASTHLPLSQISQPSSLVSVVNKAPTNGVTGGDSPHDYERLAFFQPSRPAPRPPGAIHSTYATLAAYSGKILLCVQWNNETVMSVRPCNSQF